MQLSVPWKYYKLIYPDLIIMSLKKSKAYITWVLIIINFLFFYLEIAGNTNDIENLYKLGGLLPEAVWAGQYWRLITANFIHYDWAHLLTNLVGLYFLGRFVELSLGIIPYLIAYFISGIGSMFLFSYLFLRLGITGQVLVGASAAIMGLVGVICAIFIRDWYLEKSRLTTLRLRLILVVIGIQFILDLLMPEVSFLSHFFGVVIGFFTGLVLVGLKSLKRT